MALPKVGVQVVVQDMAKFTRDIAGVEKTILKMSKNMQGLDDLSGRLGMGNLFGFGTLSTVLGKIAPALGLVIPLIQGLGVAFKVITNPIKKAWEAIKDFVGELGERAWSAIKSFGKAIFDFLNPIPELIDVVKRTVSIAFGVLVRDTIRAIGDSIRDMANQALVAASNFQLLEIRLRGLIMRDLMEGVDVTKTVFRPPTDEERLALFKYTDALTAIKTKLDETKKAYAESVQATGEYSRQSLELKLTLEGLTNQFTAAQNQVKALTLNSDGLIQSTTTVTEGAMQEGEAFELAQKEAKKLLLWVGKLAITSPFSTTDVANAFTMARGFGLTTEMAKSSTEAVMNFASGMGLTGDQMEKILINFGQMWQQGKITGTELRDLARGSLVPTTRVFEIMGKKVGKTAAEMRKLGSTGKVSVADFITAFNEMAMKDFPNAARNMTRTFEGLKERIRDLIETSLGMFVLKPAMDTFSGRLADMFDNLLSDPRLFGALDALGIELGKSMELIMDAILPKDTASITDGIIKFLEAVRDLIYSINTGNPDLIFEQLLKMGVPEWVVNSVKNLKLAWEGFNSFIDEIKPTLVAGIREIIGAIGFELPTAEDLTGGLKGLADYLSSNSTTIKNQIQEIIDKIVRFITIVRTGQIPGAMTTGASANLAAQAEEGLNIPIQKVVETGGLDKIAQKIHQIAVDMASFVDKLSPMLKSFVEINKETVESIAKSLERIISAVTGENVDLTTLSVLESFLNFISTSGQIISKILDGIATALERVLFKGEYEVKQPDVAGTMQGTMEDIYSSVNEYLGTEDGKTLKAIQDFTDEAEGEFKLLDDSLIGKSVIPDMLKAIERKFVEYFSLGGTMMKAVMNFVAEVIRRFREMYEEVVRGSIVPDMMEDINKEMTGGMDSAVKQSSQIMDEYLRMMQQGANYARGVPFASGSSSQNVYNNYSVQVDANYARTQSPVTIRYDVEAAIAAMML